MQSIHLLVTGLNVGSLVFKNLQESLGLRLAASWTSTRVGLNQMRLLASSRSEIVTHPYFGRRKTLLRGFFYHISKLTTCVHVRTYAVGLIQFLEVRLSYEHSCPTDGCLIAFWSLCSRVDQSVVGRSFQFLRRRGSYTSMLLSKHLFEIS